MPNSDVVDTIPFMVFVSIPVVVAKLLVFDEITELVATTPFIVVVNVLPESV